MSECVTQIAALGLRCRLQKRAIVNEVAKKILLRWLKWFNRDVKKRTISPFLTLAKLCLGNKLCLILATTTMNKRDLSRF